MKNFGGEENLNPPRGIFIVWERNPVKINSIQSLSSEKYSGRGIDHQCWKTLLIVQSKLCASLHITLYNKFNGFARGLLGMLGSYLWLKCGMNKCRE